MPKTHPVPLVAICGRPNVGKSTLFNRIVGKQRAIVHGEEGITRDRTYGTAEWNGRVFRLVDTGGVVENPLDPVSHKVQAQVRAALREADAIILVVDGQQEITRTDEELRDEQCHRVERTYGRFTRSFSLPPTVDPGKVSADYKAGVLTVRLPMREEAKPRQIQVQVEE